MDRMCLCSMCGRTEHEDDFPGPVCSSCVNNTVVCYVCNKLYKNYYNDKHYGKYICGHCINVYETIKKLDNPEPENESDSDLDSDSDSDSGCDSDFWS